MTSAKGRFGGPRHVVPPVGRRTGGRCDRTDVGEVGHAGWNRFGSLPAGDRRSARRQGRRPVGPARPVGWSRAWQHLGGLNDAFQQAWAGTSAPRARIPRPARSGPPPPAETV